MKLKEFNFNSLKSVFPCHLCVMEEGATVLDRDRCFEGITIGETLIMLPAEWAEREIKEKRWFFNEFVIVVEKGKKDEHSQLS